MEITTRLRLLLTFMYVQFYFICLYGSEEEGELAFLLCYFTAAINFTVNFIGLTESSEMPYQGHCKVLSSPSAFQVLFCVLLHLTSLFLGLGLLRKSR